MPQPLGPQQTPTPLYRGALPPMVQAAFGPLGNQGMGPAEAQYRQSLADNARTPASPLTAALLGTAPSAAEAGDPAGKAYGAYLQNAQAAGSQVVTQGSPYVDPYRQQAEQSRQLLGQTQAGQPGPRNATEWRQFGPLGPPGRRFDLAQANAPAPAPAAASYQAVTPQTQQRTGSAFAPQGPAAQPGSPWAAALGAAAPPKKNSLAWWQGG